MNRLASFSARSSLLPSSKFSRFALAVGFLLTGLVVLVVRRVGHQANTQLFSDLLQSVMVAWAGICAARVTLRSTGYLRRLWLLLTVSLSLITVAQSLETYYENIAHTPFATPWPSDILFILWVIPALIMLLPQPNEEFGAIAWETILDFAQVGIVALTAYLYFFYLTSRWEAEGPQMVMKEILLQMYRDLAIAAAFLIRSRANALLPAKALFRRVSLFFLLAAGASMAYLLSVPARGGQAKWYDVAWCLPYLFVTAFASRWRVEEAVAAGEQLPPGKATIFSRLWPVCVPLLVLLMSQRIAHKQATLAWAAITASFLVSTTRLILTNEKQQRVSDSLRQTEKALQQSSEMFTTAFQSSLDAISISSVPDGRYLVVNESFLRMTGFTQEEVLGKSAADLQLWVDEEQRARILSRLHTGAEVRQEEFLLRTKAGEIRTAQVSAARIQLGDRAGVLGMVRDVTDRRRAEEALRVSEERFRTLVQDLHIGIVLLGPNDETLFANRAVLDMFGVREDDVLSKSSAQFKDIAIREDGQEIPFGEIPGPRAIATKKPVHGEVVGWRRAGSREILWTLVDAIPHLTQQREVANVILSISDITERKKTEEALRESEERFRTLVENLHVGVALMGPRAEILFVNQAALEIFGLSREQVLGKTSEEFGFIALREDGTEIPFEKRPAPLALATGESVRNQVMGWRRPGSEEVLWILGEVVPLSSKNGKPDRLVTAFSDITQRKRAEEALRASEERFRTLVENLHIGVVLLGPTAEILFLNHAAQEMFGLSLEQVLGKTSEELGLTEFREDGTEMPLAMRPVARALATGQPVRNEVIGWRRPGSEEVLWLLGEVVPLFNREGRVDKLVAAVSDITKHKEAEEALHQLSARLLRLQDEERRRLGRELHDSLAQSVMAVNLDLAQVTRSSVPLDKSSRHALAEARKVLREMSREIRTLSYLLHPPVLDELGLASAVKEYAHGFSERSGISLRIDIQPDFPRMPQEAETAFFRIVQESLANIQKHSGSSTGGIRLWNGQGRVQLEIRDQGRGMAAKSGRDGGIAKGSRLGVGILGMRERMAQLRGTLEVQSNASGTAVHATIPLALEGTHATPSHPRG